MSSPNTEPDCDDVGRSSMPPNVVAFPVHLTRPGLLLSLQTAKVCSEPGDDDLVEELKRAFHNISRMSRKEAV